MLHSELCWWFSFFTNSLWTPQAENPKHHFSGWSNNFCLLWSTSACYHPLYEQLFWLWHVVVNVCSSTAINSCRNLVGLYLYMTKHSWETLTWMCFWTAISKHSLYAESFFICKYSYNILCTWSLEMFKISTSSRILTHWSFNMGLWIFV